MSTPPGILANIRANMEARMKTMGTRTTAEGTTEKKAPLAVVTDRLAKAAETARTTVQTAVSTVRSSVQSMRGGMQQIQAPTPGMLREPIRPGVIIPVKRTQHSPDVANYQIERVLPQSQQEQRVRLR